MRAGLFIFECLLTLEAEAMRAERRHRGDMLNNDFELYSQAKSYWSCSDAVVEQGRRDGGQRQR